MSGKFPVSLVRKCGKIEAVKIIQYWFWPFIDIFPYHHVCIVGCIKDLKVAYYVAGWVQGFLEVCMHT
jgi:hypothetical protein